MKTVIFVTVCAALYLLIGFGMLVMRARTIYINLQDTLLAMLFWPLIVLMFVFYNIIEGIQNSAQTLGNKLAIRMKRMKK